MAEHTQTLRLPPWMDNAKGKRRQVGVELEMSGFELDTLAKKVAELFDLEISSEGRYERLLSGDPAGDWGIELDYDLLKRLGREKRSDKTFADEIGQSAEDVLAWAAEMLVPLEIVSPPLPLERLDEVETLITHLRNAGAKGTTDKALYAFGLQLNPDLPSHDPKLITACLKAFLCFYDWLYRRADIDLSRRITSYVDPFPTAYVKKMLSPDYWPDLATLIDDYLEHNPTRNRALDMLPLFMFLDEKRVRAKVDDERIKARPTFHYRLPDCKIDEADWGLFTVWNDWVEIERLAADETRLNDCCKAHLEYLNSPVKRLFCNWATIVEKTWLNP